MSFVPRRIPLFAALLFGAPAAFADGDEGVFQLGTVTVTAPRSGNGDRSNLDVGGATISRSQIEEFNRNTLDDALTLVPGTSVSDVGPRNESDIWIRGFDRFRVPLYLDGIPIYLPADNRLDFRRFATSDISEIQITRGFTSVIDGPGALGGSVNLVSRRVSKPVQGDARIGASFDDNANYSGTVFDGFLGTRQGPWYVEGAASENYTQHFNLSHDYTPGTVENGGQRDNSFANDYRFNVKGGYVAANGDEYSLNVVAQQGEKDNPLPDTTLAPGTAVRYWNWPAWDKQSVYWLSRTGIDDAGSFVKVRLYLDRFYNQLYAYDDASFTTQKKPSSFQSTYDDKAAGANIELDKNLFAGRDTVRASLWFRYDQHNAQQNANATTGVWYSQPDLRSEQTSYSGALENIFRPIDAVDVITGVSYDYRHLMQAQDFNTFSPVPAAPPYGAIFDYPLSDKYALNPELAVVWRYRDGGSLHASVTERTRFPTLFEQFSSKFGASTGNPNLGPEKSVNTEIGVADRLGPVHVELNLFVDHLRNAIESVPVTFPAPIGTTTQSQNVGTETHQGVELALRGQVVSGLDAGLNYAYLDYDIKTAGTVPTDVPKQKLLTYAEWRPMEKMTVIPSLDVESRRWLLVYGGKTYYRGGERVLGNLRIAYSLPAGFAVDAGVNNITDANYVVADGYHAPGRNYFVNLRYVYGRS